MKKYILIISCLLCSAGYGWAQKAMSPPTVMIVPDDIYCKTHGYTVSFQNQGITEIKPDYEKALTEDHDLHNALTQIAELINDRNSKITVVDIMTAIENSKADMAMNASNGGDESESVDEAIIRNSQADILIKVNFDVLKTGPQRQIQYTIVGTDAYTSFKFAPITGTGEPSTNTSIPILIREAIFGKMDAFLDKLLSYYTNMLSDGRCVAINFKLTGNSTVSMDTKVGQYTLKEVIDDCLFDNTVNGNGLDKVKGGRTFLNYQSIYIPLFANIRGHERKLGTKDIAQKISNELKEKYNIDSQFKTLGLGKVNFYISK